MMTRVNISTNEQQCHFCPQKSSCGLIEPGNPELLISCQDCARGFREDHIGEIVSQLITETWL